MIIFKLRKNMKISKLILATFICLFINSNIMATDTGYSTEAEEVLDADTIVGYTDDRTVSYTNLMYSAWLGDFNKVEKILDYSSNIESFDINRQNEAGEDALSIAIVRYCFIYFDNEITPYKRARMLIKLYNIINILLDNGAEANKAPLHENASKAINFYNHDKAYLYVKEQHSIIKSQQNN